MSNAEGPVPPPKATVGDAIWRMFQGGAVTRTESAILQRALRVLGGRKSAKAVLDASERLPVVPGSKVIAEGDSCTALYLVLDGSVTVERQGASVCRFRAGEFFGEMALLAGTARVATIRAAERSIVLRIPPSAVHAELRERLWVYAALRHFDNLSELPVARGRAAELWMESGRHTVLQPGEWSVGTPWLFVYAGEASVADQAVVAPALVKGGIVRCDVECRAVLLPEPEA